MVWLGISIILKSPLYWVRTPIIIVGDWKFGPTHSSETLNNTDGTINKVVINIRDFGFKMISLANE